MERGANGSRVEINPASWIFAIPSPVRSVTLHSRQPSSVPTTTPHKHKNTLSLSSPPSPSFYAHTHTHPCISAALSEGDGHGLLVCIWSPLLLPAISRLYFTPPFPSVNEPSAPTVSLVFRFRSPEVGKKNKRRGGLLLVVVRKLLSPSHHSSAP